MDQRELHPQPLGICYKIYHFIMKTLASQAMKTVTLGRTLHFGSTQVQTSSAGSKEDKAMVQPETKEQAEEKNDPCMDINMNGERKVVPPEKAPKKMVSINDNVEEINPSKKKKKRSKSFQKSNSLEQQEEERKPLRSILKVKSNLDEKSMPEC